MKRLLAIEAILLTVVALVAACGKSADHNDQDVSFAKEMVPHHQQGVTISDLALAQTTNPQILDLATRIKTAQAAEISIMNEWLDTWKAKPTDHSAMDMGGQAMHGMTTEADMRALENASGPEFDRLYLQHMTTHHKGALVMARAEIAKGKFEPAKELARQIATTQEKEIAEMAQLLSAPRAPSP